MRHFLQHSLRDFPLFKYVRHLLPCCRLLLTECGATQTHFNHRLTFRFRFVIQRINFISIEPFFILFLLWFLMALSFFNWIRLMLNFFEFWYFSFLKFNILFDICWVLTTIWIKQTTAFWLNFTAWFILSLFVNCWSWKFLPFKTVYIFLILLIFWLSTIFSEKSHNST